MFKYPLHAFTAFWVTLVLFFALAGLGGQPLFPEPPLSPVTGGQYHE